MIEIPKATTSERAGSTRPNPRGFRPELLAPAGNWECAEAAVSNGADAIYFGLERFNARMRARNFTEADLPRLMDFLHLSGVKGYVAFNTLVFANELAEAESHLRVIIASGVDAAIVQDVGIARLIRRLSPDFPIHASTQMTITSGAGVAFAEALGCQLVVLARECSLKEIAQIQHSPSLTDFNFPVPSPGSPDEMASPQPQTSSGKLPLEVFVHGALCVAYSGQCLTSESLGGRSANRGECAQACRMPYELIADGQTVPLGDRRYLLSPQDLAGLELLPELIKAGVASLKIEGRLKSPEYVANVTRVYREALDRLASESQGESGKTSPGKQITDESRYNLEMAFSRGLSTGWFRGTNNQKLVHARFGKKRGVFLGDVIRVQRDSVVVGLEAALKPGDGVVFDAGHPDQKEEGGRVYEVRGANSNGRNRVEVQIAFGRGDIDFSRIHAGDRLWKTSDPELDRRLRRTFTGEHPRFQRPVSFEVHGSAGAPLTLIARDELGNVAEVTSTMPLATAERQPLTEVRLREQFGRLGGTPFRFGALNNRLEPGVLLPLSELNRLRREAVSQLETLRRRPKRWTLVESGLERPGSGLGNLGSEGRDPILVVLVRSLPQLQAAISCGVETLYCEFEDPKKYREAVALFRARSSTIGDRPSTVFVAPPRIFKTGEDWILKQVHNCEADGYLVRNFDHLEAFADCRRIGDFSLNVANQLTAEYFINRYGLERVTASYDLNIGQLEALLRSAPPDWFEVTLHQHMPMFHMEHCVFCAFLSNGTDYTNCGRPCDRHEVRLRDRAGAEHPLKADAGCRNTVYNVLAQSGAEYLDRLLAAGARRFRLEFLTETPEQVTRTIATYRQLLGGEITGAQVWRDLKALNQLGVTRGQMSGGPEHLAGGG